MAVLKIVSPTGRYKGEACYADVMNYIFHSNKVRHKFVVVRGVSSLETAADDMLTIARKYNKHGTVFRHMILAFDELEFITYKKALEIASPILDYFADQYQIVAAVHEDTDNVHVHMVMHTVSYVTGKKYSGSKQEYYAFINFLKKHLNKRGCSLRIEYG